jgi:acetyltransferase-like isoleucine patch superfamily enzyme
MLLSATSMIMILFGDVLSLWGIRSLGVIDLFLTFILLLVIHISLCVLATRLLMLFFPIIEGEFAIKSREVARWQAQAVVALMSSIYFEPFIPFFIKPTWYRLFGAKIARGVNIGGKLLDCSLTELNSGSGVGQDALVLGHWVAGDRCRIGRVIVGKNAMIGARSLIFPGTKIGEGTTIGAMSLLTSNQVIPPNEVWLGIPARKYDKKGEST